MAEQVILKLTNKPFFRTIMVKGAVELTEKAEKEKLPERAKHVVMKQELKEKISEHIGDDLVKMISEGNAMLIINVSPDPSGLSREIRIGSGEIGTEKTTGGLGYKVSAKITEEEVKL